MAELIDALRPVLRRWPVVVAAGILGAAAVAAVSYPPDELFRSTSIVGNDPNATSANERIDYLADLDTAFGTQSVLEAISDETDVPVPVLKGSLRASRAAASGFTRVIFETSKSWGEAAEQVVTRGPEIAAEFVNRSRVASAEASVEAAEATLEAAQRRLDDADDAVQQAIDDNGLVAPNVALAELQSSLGSLQRELRLGGASLDDATRRSLETQIADLQKDLPDASSKAQAYERLVDRRDAAAEERDTAQEAVVEARQQLAVRKTLPVVTVQTIERKVTATQDFVMFVAAGGLAAAVVATIVLAWWADHGRRRQQEGVTTATDRP